MNILDLFLDIASIFLCVFILIFILLTWNMEAEFEEVSRCPTE